MSGPLHHPNPFGTGLVHNIVPCPHPPVPADRDVARMRAPRTCSIATSVWGTGDQLAPTLHRKVSWATVGVAVVVAVALTQTAVTASARYVSGRRALDLLLARAAEVFPPRAPYTILWPGESAKPGRDAHYILYPRRSVRLSAQHTISRERARSALRASGVRYVIVLARTSGRPVAVNLAGALRVSWSHPLFEFANGAVYRVDP